MEKTGHTYKIGKIDIDKLMISNSSVGVTVTLEDVTTGQTITRRGISKMMGNFSPIWLYSLEGKRNVYIAVDIHNEPCKIIKRNDSYMLHYLWAIKEGEC